MSKPRKKKDKHQGYGKDVVNIEVKPDKAAIKSAIKESIGELKDAELDKHSKDESVLFLKLPLKLIFIGLELFFIFVLIADILIILAVYEPTPQYIAAFVVLTVFGGMCGLTAYLLKRVRKSIAAEKDRIYLTGYISAILSLSALIITVLSVFLAK